MGTQSTSPMHRDFNDVSETASTDEKTALESEPLPQSKPDPRLQLDTGEEHVRIRLKWWQLWIPKDPPPPPRNSLSDAPVIPVASVSLISMLTYTWITPLMTLGYQRTLQASDLWKMDDSRSSATLSTKLDKSWTVRLEKAKTWNDKLEAGLISPGFYKRGIWVLKSLLAGRRFSGQLSTYEEEWRKFHGRKHASLALALNDTFGLFFWSGGIFKVFGDTAQLMGPLLVKAIINFAKHRAAAIENGTNPPNIGIGIAMAFGLFFITIMASVTQHQFFWRSMITGILSRAALISAIYKRGVNLTGKARTQLTNSDLMNHISTDVSRIDACAQWFHAGWTAPVQVTVCLIILLTQLGPSALAGFALFLCIAPIQERVMAHQFKVRKQSMKFTDRRAKTLLEVLGSMRVVKYFSYEEPFLDRISNVRADELDGIRRIQNLQSANAAFAFSIPVLAATLAFVTYTRTTDGFDVAIIFSSLSLFQLLRQPMMFLPRALSAISDARNALNRLTAVFHAELRDNDALQINPDLKWAVEISHVTFEWESSLSPEQLEKKEIALDSSSETHPPFQLRDINMHINRGALVAIVGRVGCGKSSLLQGLIGEMRKVSGSVVFGGRVAYCAQSAWIQNTSLRENIVFGQPFDEKRYWEVIDQACLLPDLELLPDGDMTEIGEKGINLSGGQKQRINVARALYYNADVVILDDPLSAVDAHVGNALFHHALRGYLRRQGKTVILVTHALHVLRHCDYIYTLHDGRMMEHGTYEHLLAEQGEFARLDREFGGSETRSPPKADTTSTLADHDGKIEEMKIKSGVKRAAGSGKVEGRIMIKEKRTTGSVSRKVYAAYLHAGRGYITVPFLAFSILMMQGSQIVSSYTLVWWQANTFNRPFSFYQILYAVLGISQATATFLLGLSTDTISWFVSRNLHNKSIRNIFHAPMSFFDTTPMGRIIGVFGKDLDSAFLSIFIARVDVEDLANLLAIDNQLPISMRLLSLTVSNVVGAVLIITVLEHYFILVAIAISFGYQYFAAFYRASAREVKRLDSMLRSLLYSHLSESLTGLPTLRSYGEIPRFVTDNQFYIDLENRALFLTVTNQRWLAIRLDFCGACLVFFVAIFAVVGVSGINAAQIGLVLTYTTSLTQLCGMLTRQTADVENYMNSVERVTHYSQSDLIEQEPPHEIPDHKPPPTWPENGTIIFENVSMRYRPGLPNVLHNISMSIHSGEKIGVVGRTGAGKSSLTLALLRMVEYSGLISIDGIDISKIGLRDLRTKVSIIPQDPIVFSGTIRTTLDPFSIYDDAKLWDALRRSYLIDTEPSEKLSISNDGNRKLQRKISLDTVIEPEGGNLSVGEKSLLNLARALVRDTTVVILDEATASVDLETDKKIQHTIQTQFSGRTLICIAHRLRTVLSYNRILVLDSGKIMEFDTPAKLFDMKSGIFRELCDRSSIKLEEIEKSAESV